MGIQVVGHTSFLGHTGYNNHSRNFFTHLNKYIPTRVRNYTTCEDLSYLKPEEHKLIIQQKLVNHSTPVGFPFVPKTNDLIVNIVLNESHHYFFYDRYEHPMVAYNVWESTRQLPEFFNRVLEYDQFWCPTEWQRRCTIEQGYPEDRVKVVPEAVNGKIFYPSNDKLEKYQLFKKYDIPEDAFVFMVFGRWDYRKATTEMIESWHNTFGKVDNCYLVLSVDNPFPVDEMNSTEERLKHFKLEHERIRILHFPPRDIYIKWLQHGSCLISCSRSEGWNLPLIESLACGTPSICSNWGGHLQFADNIAYKVNVPIELPPKNIYFLGDKEDLGVWGEPDFNHLQHVMKKVYNNYKDVKQETVDKSKALRDEYTWDNAAKIARDNIEELVKPFIQVPRKEIPLVRYFDIAPSFDGLEMEVLLKDIFPSNKITNYEVHAFEPCEDSFKQVTEKFKNFENVTFHKLAVWKNEEKLKLFHSFENPHGNSLFEGKYNVDREIFEEVDCVRFSKWLSENIKDLDKSFNILRYNIEGAELELFKDLDENNLFRYFNIVTGVGSEDLKKCSELLYKVEEFEKIRKKNNIDAPNFDPTNWKPIDYLIKNEINKITDPIYKKPDQKKFFVKFSSTVEGFPKVTFEPKRDYRNITVKMKNSFGDILYETKFEEVKKGLNYWVSANYLEEKLIKLEIEFIDSNYIVVQSEEKKYRKEKPVVSFITSFYNAEKYVDDISSSIFSQTYKNWEWVITDDYSSDETKKKLVQLARKDIRVKLITQKKKQEVYWNPHKYAEGKYILTIDADDQIVPKTAEIIANLFDNNPQISCIHTNANYYLNDFDKSNFRNSSYCRFDNYENILDKHPKYLKNESGYERLGYMFGVIRAYRNPGPDFDFNDGDFKLGKHEDLVKLIRLEEIGQPLYFNRTLYKVRMREDSHSGSWGNNQKSKENDFDKIYKVANNRRTVAYKHDDSLDNVREELYSFLYSDLNEESSRKRVLCLGFDLKKEDQDIIRFVYYDHEVVFDQLNFKADYIFVMLKNERDIEPLYKQVNKINNVKVTFFLINNNWNSDFYSVVDSSNYFPLFSNLKIYLSDKTVFSYGTYLYKYCFVTFTTPKGKELKLNLGCGNDIKSGYINVDKFNNTGRVDLQCDIGDLPYENETVDEIYSSHVFEHVPINDVYSVLAEWERLLKIGGKLLLRLPNLETEVKIWLDSPPEKKWFEISRIFGGQSYEGNAHFNGHTPESLKWLLERFSFKVVKLEIGNSGFGEEIQIEAEKIESVLLKSPKINVHFIDGPFVEILGDHEDKGFYVVDFIDLDNNSLVHQKTMEINTWTRPHRKYFTNWLIKVSRNGKLIYEHKFDIKQKNVLVSFDSKSLGDSIAWVPQVEEFRKKYNCKVYLSTFWNHLFNKSYPNINFVDPGSVVQNLYASFTVGCWEGNLFKNKIDWREVTLGKVCSDILGIDYEEIICNLSCHPGPRPIKDKYVTISEFSTFQCKFWNYSGGWQDIVNYLNDIGYKVMSISKEETKLKNVIKMNNKSIEETITNIGNSDFFIGVSSGPSWIAWCLKKPVLLISGSTPEITEFQNNCERIINKDVCHACFKEVNNNFDRGDWMWCPFHKGTKRQFECTKSITPDMVIASINKLVSSQVNICETKELFYTPPKNKLKNLRYEARSFSWNYFHKFGPVVTAYHEIFIQEDYKHGKCKVDIGDIVVDIGANIGIFTRYAHINGAKKILSFEAEKNNFDHLLRNKPKNCIAFNLAVSDNNNKQDLFISNLEGSHTLLESHKEENCRSQQIQCITLNEIFKTHNLDKIDFLKMDIEGSEIQAFDGISDENLLKINKIAMEYHHMSFSFDNNIRESFIQRFIQLGFNIYKLHLKDDCLNMLYFWK